MARFVIECSQCGKYAQANSGLFGFIGRTRKVDCACGHVINVDAEKFSSRECPHCGNHVVFDQSKGEKAKCPVCGEPINTMAEQNKTAEFSCAQCGIRLRTSKGAATYTCPVCDHENVIAERIANEELKKSGRASIIKYEGSNEALIWKHPIEDFCLGSQLIVDESQEAIFYRDGQALDTFPAGTHTLDTQRLPLLDQVYNLPLNNTGAFHSKVYYVNLVTHMGIKWGVGEIHLYEPKYALPVELGLRGTFNVKIINARKLLLKIVGSTGAFTRDQLMCDDSVGMFRDMVRMQVRSHVSAAIQDQQIDLLDIDRHTIDLAKALREKLNPSFYEYGLEISEFIIGGVKLPDSKAFMDAKEQHEQEILRIRQENLDAKVIRASTDRVSAELELELLKARAEAEIMKIKANAEAEVYERHSVAEAREMQMKGYTYKDETARQVSMAAMKNGVGGINDGGSSILGDLVGLGMTAEVIHHITDVTKNALDPNRSTKEEIENHPKAKQNTWDCTCGNKNITGNFCTECGSKRPIPQKLETWNCACGNKNITGKFCTECGAKRPETVTTWNCACGNQNITGKFCGECGAKRPEAPATWDCACGNKGITGKFCTECGKTKGQ